MRCDWCIFQSQNQLPIGIYHGHRDPEKLQLSPCSSNMAGTSAHWKSMNLPYNNLHFYRYLKVRLINGGYLWNNLPFLWLWCYLWLFSIIKYRYLQGNSPFPNRDFRQKKHSSSAGKWSGTRRPQLWHWTCTYSTMGCASTCLPRSDKEGDSSDIGFPKTKPIEVGIWKWCLNIFYNGGMSCILYIYIYLQANRVCNHFEIFHFYWEWLDICIRQKILVSLTNTNKICRVDF